MIRAACLALALLASASRAQETPAPQSHVEEAGLEEFRLCRAAVFHHLDGEPDRRSRVPRSVALTLLDQLDFIMAESTGGQPHGTLDEAKRALRFSENFFIGFNQTLARTDARFSDPQERDRTLIRCIPLVWSVARGHVEDLAAWRRKFDPTPTPLTPQEARERQIETERMLGIREE